MKRKRTKRPARPQPVLVPLTQEAVRVIGEFLMARQIGQEPKADVDLAVHLFLHDLLARAKVQATTRHCRRCGCTNDKPCLTKFGPCSWWNDDLCSACITDEEIRRHQLHLGRIVKYELALTDIAEAGNKTASKALAADIKLRREAQIRSPDHRARIH